MTEMNPNAVSLEEPTLDGPPIQPDTPQEPQETPAVAAADDDAEPEGVVEHQGKRLVDVSVLSAERKRTRAATERALREKEITPLQQQLDQLKGALSAVQPFVEQIRQHGMPQPPKPTKAEELVSDEEAAAEARDLELYDSKTGQPDIGRAKRIIARRRQDAQAAAQQAAQAAVGPITSQTAQSASKQNFAAYASQRDPAGQPLVDPKLLAEMWVQLPAELTQHPEVGQLILDAAIGKSVRTTGRVQRAERAPVLSEPAGGRTGPQWQMDRMAKSLAQAAGLTEKAFTEGAKGYQPGAVNVLGD